MTLEEASHLTEIDALDRELLLATILKKDRVWLLTHPKHELSAHQLKRLAQYIQRRKENEPLAYILGEKEFFGLPFFVNRWTLIPRPETEILVESVLEYLKKQKNHAEGLAIVDVGTGSGCIITSLVTSIPNAHYRFFATDISKRALVVAKKNAKRYGVSNKISFIHSDLIATLIPQLRTFDAVLITANLPYLSEKLYQKTEPTVHDFEPRTALLSGQDGLDHYRRLLAGLASLAKGRKVRFWLEISPEQAPQLPSLFASVGAKQEKILPDLSGRARVITGSF